MRDRWLSRAVIAWLMTAAIAFSGGNPGAAYAFDPDDSPPPAKTCPHDTVVWVNTRSGVYHFPGQAWFGRTRQGEYMCKREADKEGFRPTRNGQ
jgi:hypothetical protein